MVAFVVSTYAAPSKTETFRDIIKKAQLLTLQKDRTQALLILTQAIKKESGKVQAQKDLIKAAQQISEIFLTEVGQQTFELSRSMSNADLNLSIEKLREAQRLEPDNVRILIELSVKLLSQMECGKAKEFVSQITSLNPFHPREIVLQGQVAACAKDADALARAKAKAGDKNPIWVLNEIYIHGASGDLAKVKQLVVSHEKELDRFPETYYFKWKTEEEGPQKVAFAEKYIKNCQTKSGIQNGEVEDPWMCGKTSEVLGYLKKE